jgi:hypothetical protein
LGNRRMTRIMARSSSSTLAFIMIADPYHMAH